MEDPEVVEHFFGVYLLYCTNPKYKGRTYIGYTVNPTRRIKQHNAGKEYGGAWKTSKKGPWNMVLIVYGFPNNTSALRFEWAWQHPHLSRRLKHVPKKRSSQKSINFYLMVLSEMLQVGPWHRLPLTVRWLDYEFSQNYTDIISPPLHMPICYGKVTSKKVNRKKDQDDIDIPLTQALDESIVFCSLCGLSVQKKEIITCIKPGCLLIAHLICLAEHFRKDDMLIPIQGTCPACEMDILWGDLIRKKLGCYQNLLETCSSSDDSESSN